MKVIHTRRQIGKIQAVRIGEAGRLLHQALTSRIKQGNRSLFIQEIMVHLQHIGSWIRENLQLYIQNLRNCDDRSLITR